MNLDGAIGTLGLGIAFCAAAVVIEILDRRGSFQRQLEQVRAVKEAKEAVRRGDATEEQRLLDKEWVEERNLTLNPVDALLEGLQNWFYSSRFGRILIELWLFVHGVLLLTGIPGVLRGARNVLGYQLLAWWFVGFWPAVGLYGVTFIVLAVIGAFLVEEAKEARRRTVPLRRFLRTMTITAGTTAAIAAVAAWLGWLTWLIGKYPAAWEHLRHLPT